MDHTNKSKILLVEDEENLLEAIRLNLELEGYETETAVTGKEAIRKTVGQHYNLIILDVMLPELDGFSVCEKIRITDSDTPILFLTAKNEHSDKVKGFKLGADDYLSKPFNLEELLMRVRVLIKHSTRGTKQQTARTYRFAGNEINFITFTAKTRGGKEVELTKKEMELLKLLVDRKGNVVSRSQILHFVWGYDVNPSTRTIDNFILNFRKYFEKDASNPRHFHSVRGVGYRFTEEPVVE